MIRPLASLRLIAGVLTSLFAVLGCGADRADDPRRSDSTAARSEARTVAEDVSPAGLCDSSLSADGLVCSRCADQPAAECLPAFCTVENHCLRCTDPKGRSAVDCSIDFEGTQKGGFSTYGSDVSFAECGFTWGEPRTSGTTCEYPGGKTCQYVEGDGGYSCLECRLPRGGGGLVCGTANDPLIDPLVGRPDDLPAPGFCINDLSADGKVQCTTCARDDASATRSCHYPGIVDCNFDNPADQAAGCLGRCTFADGHQERVCDSPRGIHPVPLP